MPAIKLQKFGGMLPAWDDSLLPEGQATSSRDAYLYSGALLGWRKPKLLHTLINSAAQFAYRIPLVSSATAKAYLVFTANVSEGDTLKIGEIVYKFTAAVTNAFDVLLGANSTLSATNLFKALGLTGTMGVTYGTGTCLNGSINDIPIQTTHDFGAGALPVIQVNAPDIGAAFNLTVVTEASASLLWLFDLVSLADTTVTLAGGANQTADLSITGPSKWMEFIDQDTNVVKSSVFDDQFNRYYFASPSLPPQYNTYDRIVADQVPWLLGVPAPGCSPGLVVTDGGNTATLGYPTSLTAGIGSFGNNTLILTKVTTPGAMIINDVAVMPEFDSTTAKFKGVLYADNAGNPSGLLDIGVEVVGCLTGTAVVSPFQIPLGLLGETSYWIGFIIDSDAVFQLADAVSTDTRVTANAYGSGPPSVAPAMVSGFQRLTMWADTINDAILESRAYVYTWVTAYDEEGPPSPPTIADAWTNSTWTVGLFQPPSDDMGVVRNITKTRIYRTITATGGGTTYFLLAEQAVALNTFVDTITDDVAANNSELTSTNWFPPPEGLQGIADMPNGIMVGFKGNEIWFCEPYRPHAWPRAYVITVEFPIVGIGVVGQSVVAATEGSPAIANGINPASMALTKTHIPEPCLSRGSVIAGSAGVFYVSNNGLILVVESGSAANVTESWITRERWRKLTPTKFIRAIKMASSYFAFGTVSGTDHTQAQAGFNMEMTNDSSSFGILPQAGGHRIGFNSLQAPGGFDVVNIMQDAWTGIALTIQNNAVYQYDFADDAPEMIPFKWRSKMIQQTSKKNFEAFRVWFSVPTNTPALNPVRNTSEPQPTLAADQYLIVRVYAGSDAKTLNLVTTREVRASGELLRIKSGFKYEFWQFEFEGRVEVSNLQAATTVTELRSI